MPVRGGNRLSRREPFESGARRQYRFGEYELDLERGGLRRAGEEITLRAKSFDVLAVLVERNGRLVTKADLIDAVWPDTSVADNSLAQCILEIRRAIDDEAQQMIRTVARRGYIFEAAVTSPPVEFPKTPALAPMLVEPPAGRLNRRVLGWAALTLAVALAAILALATIRRPVPNAALSFTQITSFTDSAVNPVLSPDGKMLAFYRSDRSFFTSDQVFVKMLPDGEPVQLTHDPRPKYGLAFSPDGSLIAYTAISDTGFDTYTVSSLGGESRLFLPNAAGLTWLDAHTLLFSETKRLPNMGIVTSTESRSESREIYFPAYQRGMAHYSYASPDRQSVLVVEMNPDWLPCRLVPWTGSSAGRQVGPSGACTSAAWSPDGEWMYFGAAVNGKRHLWRQHFPNGQPEQITFGPAEEDGIAVAPDGRSLITSVAMKQGAVWIHDAKGDRAVSTEGYAHGADDDFSPPLFSGDGKRLYYLSSHSPDSATELRRLDLDSGQSGPLLPGISIRTFDISRDEKEVVFATQPDGQTSQLWLAPLDRSGAPRRIAAGGEAFPHFGPDGQVLFRMSDGKALYLERMRLDGSGSIKVVPFQILNFKIASPDRRYAVVFAPALQPSAGHVVDTLAIPIAGGPVRRICALCEVAWSADGRYLYLTMGASSRDDPAGKTLAIPVPPGESLPALPEAGIRDGAEALEIPGARIVAHSDISPGPDPSVYAYVQAAVHANLFRIALR